MSRSTQVDTPGVTPIGEANTALPGCKARASAYRRVRALRARRGVRFSVAPRRGTFRVDVFEASRGRSVVRAQRLVARFRGRRKAFTWDGRGQGGRRIRDGYLTARVVSTRPAGGSEVKRFALRRLHGRYAVRSAYDRTSQCGLLRFFRASR